MTEIDWTQYLSILFDQPQVFDKMKQFKTCVTFSYIQMLVMCP